MSFMLTKPQFLARTKDVTRRCGWWFAKAGDVYEGVEKGQGLKKGETVVRIGQIRVLSVRPERLGDITDAEVVREGFPEMTPADFIDMFCKANKCTPAKMINRIEFEYMDGGHA